jgi:hypothetical protein
MAAFKKIGAQIILLLHDSRAFNALLFLCVGIANNAFTGKLPTEMGQMSLLRVLQLGKSSLNRLLQHFGHNAFVVVRLNDFCQLP